MAVNPPLAIRELTALKQSIAVLAGLGTLLAQTSRNPALSGQALVDVRLNISRMRTALPVLEQRTHDFVRAALISWESRSA